MLPARYSPLWQSLSRHWLSVAFLLGFITDLILLDRIDDWVDNLILLFYVALATLSLVLFYVGVAERVSPWLVRKLALITPITMQYAFGGLLSGMLIFYGRSGDWFASAPFLLLIVGVILANELVTRRSERLLYNVSVYFIGIFSYCVLILPVWTGATGNFIFYASGVLALAITMALIKILKQIIPNFLTMQKRLLVFSVGGLYVLFNAMYFFNFIPPIPLSLIDLEIYQEMSRDQTSGIYTITKEVLPWYSIVPGLRPDFSPLPGKGAACFARVFAPAKISTTIVHRWEFINADGEWQERYRLAYPISGENTNGYRGFSLLTSITSGRWRCSVENERGQVLGRHAFTVDTSKVPASLVTVTE